MNRIACYVLFAGSFLSGVAASRWPVGGTEQAGSGVSPGKISERDGRSWSAGERKARIDEILQQPDDLLESRLEVRGHFAALPMATLKQLCQVDVRDTWEGHLTEDERLAARLRQAAIREWCDRDPFGFLDERPKAGDIERAMAWRAAAGSDPSRANKLATAAGSDLGFRERTAFLQGLAEGDPALAFSAARALSDEDLDYTGVAEVAEGFADPVLRLKWADLVFERSGVREQPDLYQIFRGVAEDDPDLLERSMELKVVSEYQESVRRTAGEQRLKNTEPGSPVPYPEEGERYAGWELEGRRLARWFVRDPGAVRKWLDEAPSMELRGSLLAALAGAASVSDLASLDRLIDSFPNAEDRESVVKAAAYFLDDGEVATRASLRNFVGKYPEALPFVEKPEMLAP